MRADVYINVIQVLSKLTSQDVNFGLEMGSPSGHPKCKVQLFSSTDICNICGVISRG
jgi:hypothetical protein